MQQAGEARELLVGGALGALDLLEALLQPGAVVVVAHRLARDGEDPPALRQLAVAKRLEQGRHELAPGQVAGAADDDEIE